MFIVNQNKTSCSVSWKSKKLWHIARSTISAGTGENPESNYFQFTGGHPNSLRPKRINESNKDFIRQKKLAEYVAGLSRSNSGTF